MRRARVRTAHAAPTVVADAVEPDNTDSMTTRVDGATVETTIERETTGGLHSSVDDYVVNLTVADRLTRGEPERSEGAGTDHEADRRPERDSDTDRRPDPTDDQTDPTHDTDTDTHE